jgi:sn-1 stearoyl-lipid 9-desaturase
MMGQEQRDFYKVNSLTHLDKASPVEGTIVWDAPRSLWNSAMLLGAVVLGPLTFSWSALAVFLITAAITLCAGHRHASPPARGECRTGCLKTTLRRS